MPRLVVAVLQLYHVSEEELAVGGAEEVTLGGEYGHEVVVVFHARRPNLLGTSHREKHRRAGCRTIERREEKSV